MEVARTKTELGALLRLQRRATRRIGFVPTMGYLHEGHLSLVRRARSACDFVVLSIFVNPLQFGPHEDYERYPRDEERDLSLAQKEGVDVVFLPEVDDLYSRGRSSVVSVGDLGQVLEGEKRPGHFDGVCTVVAILFNLVRPDVAFFGQKDAQQVAMIRGMVADLCFPVEISVCPTVRRPDGLAVSSRNAYLSGRERAQARALYRALVAGREALLSGERIAATEKKMEEVLLKSEGVTPEYARAVDPETFDEPTQGRAVLLAIAARVGGTRLIDCFVITSERYPEGNGGGRCS